ncbi:hypothetical protein [Mycobacterium sp.]|uniref:hypothetical protein n=1 Tax=Mycobacterium sp. TaxID=1785 RepID=UPI003BAC318F
MALPNKLNSPEPGDDTDSAPEPYDDEPPIDRVRVVVLDVICTVAMWIAVFVVATTTRWPAELFGFLDDVCAPGTCAPVPYGVDIWIYPVVWGGIGAAISAAIIGPCVSLIKGWYMSVWLVVAIAIVFVSSLAGYAMTTFCQTYWY